MGVAENEPWYGQLNLKMCFVSMRCGACGLHDLGALVRYERRQARSPPATTFTKSQSEERRERKD